MCTAITLEEQTVDVVIEALTAKMEEINICAIVLGVRNDKMKYAYAKYEKTLDLFNKAKDSFSTAKVMAMET